MILQRNKSYVYKGKTNYKFIIMVPQKDVDQLGWKAGIELEGIAIKGKGYFLSKV